MELGLKENIRSLSLFLISFIFQCNGVSWQRQLEHIAKTRLESQGLFNDVVASSMGEAVGYPTRNHPPYVKVLKNIMNTRSNLQIVLNLLRRFEFDPRELTDILGRPNRPSHLPEAEAILPGHTLNRPTLGMLKSSVKFPHRDLENGAGVYGSIDNLGIKYDSKSERLLYTGFRRFPADYIMVIPSNLGGNNIKPRLESTVLDLDGKDEQKIQLLKIIKKLNNPAIKGNVRVYFGDLNKSFLNNLRTSEEVESSYNWYKNIKNDDLYNLDGQKLALRNKETEDQKQKLEIMSIENPFDAANTDKEDTSKKTQWLLNLQDNFNHIRINQEAPELNELVPPLNDKDNEVRQWWFYSADDYKQFS